MKQAVCLLAILALIGGTTVAANGGRGDRGRIPSVPDPLDDEFVFMNPSEAPPAPTGPSAPLPWAGPPPGPDDEVFIYNDAKEGVRHWVVAIAYREWQRWVSFLMYGRGQDIEALVPIQLSMFPQGVWNQVMTLCRWFRHECEMDSATGDLNKLKRRCAYCFGDQMLPCNEQDPRYCQPAFCDRCNTSRTDVLNRLSQANRQVTARVRKPQN
jgi:hypothetical protein